MSSTDLSFHMWASLMSIESSSLRMPNFPATESMFPPLSVTFPPPFPHFVTVSALTIPAFRASWYISSSTLMKKDSESQGIG